MVLQNANHNNIVNFTLPHIIPTHTFGQMQAEIDAIFWTALQPTIHFYAAIQKLSNDSAVSPHCLDLVNVITPDGTEHSPSDRITVGSKINLNIVEDAVSPTDNAFPVSYYAFQG